MGKKCSICGSQNLRQTRDGCVGDEVLYRCRDCDNVLEESDLEDVTVFDSVTISPEVLAEKLVYFVSTSWGEAYWTSTITEEKEFESYEKAIAATVAKLKEVCYGQN